jgi:flagellar assembly protein FliH
MSELVKRIPAETIEDCNSWVLPEMVSKKIIPAIKQRHNNLREEAKKKYEAKKQNATEASAKKTTTESIEKIEEIIPEEVAPEPMTAERLQKITEDAEKEGFDKGYKEGLEKAKEDGFKEGEKKGKAQVDDNAKRLQKLAGNLEKPLEKELSNLESQLLDIVCHLTRTLTKKELTTDSSMIKTVVNESLALLQSKDKNVTLFLHPQDIELIRETLKDEEFSVHCEADNALLPGGCRIQNKDSTIDASINKQLDQLLDDFLHKSHPKIETPVTTDEHDENKEPITKESITTVTLDETDFPKDQELNASPNEDASPQSIEKSNNETPLEPISSTVMDKE